MMLILFLKGFLLGFSMAAPVGPIGILCIQSSLRDGFRMGLITGLGATLADAAYGLVAGLGLTVVFSFLMRYQFEVRSLGGLFLVYLAIKIFFTKPKAFIVEHEKKSAWRAFGTTFALTLTSPVTVVAFLAIFASLGLGSSGTGDWHVLLLVSGITLGSACWWLLLSAGVAYVLHHRLSPSMVRDINRCSGIMILAFAAFILWPVFHEIFVNWWGV